MALIAVAVDENWYDELVELRKKRLELIEFMLEKRSYDGLTQLTTIEHRMCEIAREHANGW